MKTVRFAIVLALIPLSGFSQWLDPDSLRLDQIRPAMITWDFGAPEYATLETIYLTTDSAGSHWNVTHTGLHPTDSSAGFDYYRINAQNLRPEISRMYHPGFINYLLHFDTNRVQVRYLTDQTDTSYMFALGSNVYPEGPGTPVFLAALPLSLNYKIRYCEVNRWTGAAGQTAQIDTLSLTVTGTDSLLIDGMNYPVYKIELRSSKGRQTDVWALQQSPHYWVQVHHSMAENRIMKSRAVKLVVFKS